MGCPPPPPPVWTMLKKTALFWNVGFPKMIVCIKYQTCWKYSKYSCHIVTSYMCSRWTINSHYVLLCNISLMLGSSWATSYIMSTCRHRKKREQLSLWSWLRLNSRDDTEKQSTLFPVVDTKNRLWLKMGTLDFSLQAKKGWLPIAKLKKIYKDRLDSGVTWLKWLPHSMEQYGRLAPKSNKVNYQKLTLYFKKIHR